jgi:hypothetical protein
MKTIQINIFDTDLVWKGAIDNVISFIHRSSWYEIINSELTISRTAQGVEELVVGRVIVVNNDLNNALIIEEMNANVAENDWNIILIPLRGLLNYRIAHPTDSGSFTAAKQSEVMMLLASKNLVTQSRDTDRKFWSKDGSKLMFTVASTKTYGDAIDYTVDWGTGALGDAIVEVANMFDDVAGKYPIGWNIYIKSTLDGFQMDCYQYTNRSINQTTNRPVVFSEEYNNIQDATYFHSLKDWHNMAYMTWNDGTNDQTTAIANVKHGTSSGFNRKEIIIDSSKEKANDVVNEGRAELNKRPLVENFTAEIINNPNTMSTFNVDWFLGDVVTIQTKAIKKDTIISVDAQIIQIEEVYDNGEYTIHAIFGEQRLSLIKKIKQTISQRR